MGNRLFHRRLRLGEPGQRVGSDLGLTPQRAARSTAAAQDSTGRRRLHARPSNRLYMLSSGRTSHSPSNSGQWTRCNSMNCCATSRAFSADSTSTSA